jgi:23S rRNA pseudouridine1911/1915/1917 synthase
VGEPVYVRGFSAPLLPAPRMMLHAAVLGFEHPTRHEHVRFEDPMPQDMTAVLSTLRPKERP